MTQNLGDEKVLAIPALFAYYETKPNALSCARNEKVACSSQVTSSTKNPWSRNGFRDSSFLGVLCGNAHLMAIARFFLL